MSEQLLPLQHLRRYIEEATAAATFPQPTRDNPPLNYQRLHSLRERSNNLEAQRVRYTSSNGPLCLRKYYARAEKNREVRVDRLHNKAKIRAVLGFYQENQALESP